MDVQNQIQQEEIKLLKTVSQLEENNDRLVQLDYQKGKLEIKLKMA